MLDEKLSCAQHEGLWLFEILLFLELKPIFDQTGAQPILWTLEIKKKLPKTRSFTHKEKKNRNSLMPLGTFLFPFATFHLGFCEIAQRLFLGTPQDAFSLIKSGCTLQHSPPVAMWKIQSKSARIFLVFFSFNHLSAFWWLPSHTGDRWSFSID